MSEQKSDTSALMDTSISRPSSPKLSPSLSSSSSSMPDDTSLSSLSSSSSSSDPLDAALKQVCVDAKKAEPCLKSILQLLSNYRKKPSNPLYKRHRMDNIVIKKITEIKGSLELILAAGFYMQEQADKKITYLQADEDKIDMKRLDEVIDVLEKKINYLQEEGKEREKAPAPANAGVRVLCVGGCGFYGDTSTESLCSVCYKKRYGMMPSNQEQKSGEPKKCVKNCGNYGNDKNQGMCSVCFKKEKQVQLAKRRGKKGFRLAVHVVMAVRKFETGKRPVQENKNRCFHCQKKVGIIGIECRCGYIFCTSHRMPHQHDCHFNFREEMKKKLERENNQISKKKIDEEME